jgi:multiple sugar transport system substrate-binding protein
MVWGGTPPDVIQVGGRNFGMYAAQGMALDLAPYARRDRENLDDFLPVTVEFSQWQGRLFAPPNDFNCLGLYYNLEHFEAAGVRPPPADWKAPGWTWQELVDAGLRLTRRDAQRFALAGIPGALTSSAPWLWAAGGDILSKDGTKVLLDQPPAVEARQFLQDLRQKHRLAPESGETGGATGNNIFFNGFAAMNIAGAAFTAMARRMIQGFRWDVCVFPAGRAGRFSATGGTQGSSWLIPAATGNKNEAWAFTRFLAGEEMQQRITRSGLIGARKAAAATARQLNAGQSPASWGMFLDGVSVTRAVPHVARWAEFDMAYGTEVGKVIAGQAAPREAGARLKEQLEPLLAGR